MKADGASVPWVPSVTPELVFDGMKRAVKRTYLAARRVALRGPSRPPAQPMAVPQRLLVIRLDRLGDAVLTTVLLQALRQSYPSAHLGYMVRAAFADLFSLQPYLDEVIAAPESPLSDRGFLDKLHNGKWDVVIDPLNSYPLKTARLAHSSGAAVTIGFDVAGRGKYFTHPLPPPSGCHLTQEALATLQGLGKSVPALKPVIHVPADTRAWAGHWLKEQGITRGVIAAHVGGTYATQRLPVQTMGEAVRKLAAAEVADILVLGGPGERGRVEAVVRAAQTGGVAAVASLPEADVVQTAALLSRARLVVANNSGPLHLAAAIGIPTLSTLGPTDAVQFDPRAASPLAKEIQHSVIRLGVRCSPCNLGWCSHHTCLRAITAGQLVYAGGQLIAAGKKGTA